MDLKQLKPTTTSAETLHRFAQGEIVNGLCVVVVNLDASARTFSIYLDEDGETADDSTSIADTVAIAANSIQMIPYQLRFTAHGGTVQVKSSDANALNFTMGELAN
jgi:hypothetical protein